MSNELIEKLKCLVNASENNPEALEIIVRYVDGLVNGDYVSSFFNYNELSEYAKKALEYLAYEVHDSKSKRLNEDID